MSRSIRVEFVDGPLHNRATTLPAFSKINPCPARWNNHPGGTYELISRTPQGTRVVYKWKPSAQRLGAVPKNAAWRKALHGVFDQGVAEGMFDDSTVAELSRQLANDETRGPGVMSTKLLHAPLSPETRAKLGADAIYATEYRPASTGHVVLDRAEVFTAIEEAMVSIMRNAHTKSDRDALGRLQQIMRKL